MKNEFTVCVYCGAAVGNDPSHKEAVKAIGASIAKSGMTIVYGGGRVGMMGILSDSALQNNGKVIGIIPEYLITQKAKHDGLYELKIVENLHIRKKMMEDAADVFLILPGGLGTLDELFEVLKLKILQQLNQPVIIFNPAGYWDRLIDLIRQMKESGFASIEDEQNFQVASTVEEVMEKIRNEKLGIKNY
jgi:uncharacterized protein (TIGR00730 family)